jgi:hypothetical protein
VTIEEDEEDEKGTQEEHVYRHVELVVVVRHSDFC